MKPCVLNNAQEMLFGGILLLTMHTDCEEFRSPHCKIFKPASSKNIQEKWGPVREPFIPAISSSIDLKRNTFILDKNAMQTKKIKKEEKLHRGQSNYSFKHIIENLLRYPPMVRKMRRREFLHCVFVVVALNFDLARNKYGSKLIDC